MYRQLFIIRYCTLCVGRCTNNQSIDCQNEINSSSPNKIWQQKTKLLEQCINFLQSFILFSFKDAEIDVSSYIEKIEGKFTGALEYFPINLSSYIGTN